MSIKIEQLTYIYEKGTSFERQALKEIDLSIEEGEFVGIIGHTGSGKSTLIQHLNGLIKPMFGQIEILGQTINSQVKDLRRLRQQVGLVFQYPENQLFEMKVYDDIAFGPKNLGLSDEDIQARVYYAIDKVGLERQMLDKSPFELSGGQKRRVAIAGVLAMQPKILILDEPTAGLDPAGRYQILSEIKQLHRESGMTIILVSHSMEEIAENAERVIVMEAGRIVLDNQVHEIFKEEATLKRLGLEIPQISGLISELEQTGKFQFDHPIITLDEAMTALTKQLRKDSQ